MAKRKKRKGTRAPKRRKSRKKKLTKKERSRRISEGLKRYYAERRAKIEKEKERRRKISEKQKEIWRKRKRAWKKDPGKKKTWKEKIEKGKEREKERRKKPPPRTPAEKASYRIGDAFWNLQKKLQPWVTEFETPFINQDQSVDGEFVLRLPDDVSIIEASYDVENFFVTPRDTWVQVGGLYDPGPEIEEDVEFLKKYLTYMGMNIVLSYPRRWRDKALVFDTSRGTGPTRGGMQGMIDGGFAPRDLMIRVHWNAKDTRPGRSE